MADDFDEYSESCDEESPDSSEESSDEDDLQTRLGALPNLRPYAYPCNEPCPHVRNPKRQTFKQLHGDKGRFYYIKDKDRMRKQVWEAAGGKCQYQVGPNCRIKFEDWTGKSGMTVDHMIYLWQDGDLDDFDPQLRRLVPVLQQL